MYPSLLHLPPVQASPLLLVGVSGGPDSVVLLHLLYEAGYPIVATHCNFHLRGAESDRDECFCTDLCQQWGIRLIVKHFDTRAYMAQHRVSLELAARQLRYQWWHELLQSNEYRNDYGLPLLAVAHHQDDSLETMLFNLMRGTGIKGLTGIPGRNGQTIRPLLQWSRTQILEYIDEHKLSYITDSSNLEDEATRNRIRHHLLPLMEQIMPQTRQRLATTQQHLMQTRQLADERLDQLFADTRHYSRFGIEWDEWDSAAAPHLAHYWRERYTSATHQVLTHGSLLYTCPTVLLTDDNGRQSIAFCPTADTLSIQTLDTSPGFGPDYEVFDADLVTLPLSIRTWREGDRIQPLGMQGTRLVSDIFTDAHLSPMHKALTPIVTDASGRILWVVGHKVSNHTKISSNTTQFLKVWFH